MSVTIPSTILAPLSPASRAIAFVNCRGCTWAVELLSAISSYALAACALNQSKSFGSTEGFGLPQSPRRHFPSRIEELLHESCLGALLSGAVAVSCPQRTRRYPHCSTPLCSSASCSCRSNESPTMLAG